LRPHRLPGGPGRARPRPGYRRTDAADPGADRVPVGASAQQQVAAAGGDDLAGRYPGLPAHEQYLGRLGRSSQSAGARLCPGRPGQADAQSRNAGDRMARRSRTDAGACFWRRGISMADTLHVGVVGAGIVGLATALWLQRSGCRVTLLDRQEPGEGTSSGNAGVFADYGRVPFASMAQLKQLPGQLLDRRGPLSIQASYLPRLLPFGLRFVRACRPEQFLAGCRAMTQLQRTAPRDDAVLLDAAQANDLVKANGALALCSTEDGVRQAREGHLK